MGLKSEGEVLVNTEEVEIKFEDLQLSRPENIFQIYQIVERISELLIEPQLERCTHVSKTWRAAFGPIL